MFSTVVVDVGRPRRRARANQVQAFRSRHRIRSRVASQVVRGVLGQSRSADSSDGPAKRSPLATVAAGTRGSLDPQSVVRAANPVSRNRTFVQAIPNGPNGAGTGPSALERALAVSRHSFSLVVGRVIPESGRRSRESSFLKPDTSLGGKSTGNPSGRAGRVPQASRSGTDRTGRSRHRSHRSSCRYCHSWSRSRRYRPCQSRGRGGAGGCSRRRRSCAYRNRE